jgi:hypothetical protein
MVPIPNLAEMRRFFAGLTEFTFETHLGVADPTLIDYISELLTRFTHHDEIFRIRNRAGQPLDQVTDMLSVAKNEPEPAQREIHRHIGDFTLFWSGMYPEALRHMQAAPRKDMFLDYPAIGKRAYHIASRLPTAESGPEPDILERLSHDFDLCMLGLAELRKEWVKRDA